MEGLAFRSAIGETNFRAWQANLRVERNPLRTNKRRRRQVVRQRSAKPPSPVQIRAAPPILTLVNAVTYGDRVFGPIRRFGNTWEQFAFNRLDRFPMRGIDHVRLDVERRRDTCVSQLFLRDLHRHLQVTQQRRVNVAELMPRHPSEPGGFGGRLKHIPQQLGLT